MSATVTDPNPEKKCPQCGAPLPTGGLGGLCPACLLQQAATETATQPAPQKFHPPTVEELARLFPQLEILSFIGRGGMGAVYKARQPQLDRLVALKILPAQVTHGTDFGERFTREARALARLHHPNIVMVYDFGQASGQPYFIMEYVDGLNLRQLEQQGKLSPREALQIVPQICEALQFAHDAGIVHRDIKPDNILLDKRGRVKIADFGIAKILGAAEETGFAATQGAIGTPHYMAPEQVEKPQTVDHRADIFSLGVVFYEMLTGELPLGKFAPPSSGPRGVQVDVRLDEVVLRALERKPDLRYQHASQVKTAVETIASTQSGGSAASSTEIPEALLARDYELSIRRSLGLGWALVKRNFWPLVGITTLIMALMAIVDSAFGTKNYQTHGVSITTTGLSVLALLLDGPLLAGLYLYYLKKIRGEAATVETAFTGFFSKRFLHLFLAHFVVTALTLLGFLCLLLPGIYLLVAWCFTLALIIDKGLDFWPAMELSRKMVHKHWWKMFFFLLAMCVLLAAGFLFCFIGFFIAAPVAGVAFMYAYEEIFSTAPIPNPARRETMLVTPAPPRPGGTMAMPAAGSPPPPPKGGATPPPAARPDPLPAGAGIRQPVKASPSSSLPIIVLLLVIGFLAVLGVGITSYFKYRNAVHTMRVSVSSPAAPAAPEPPAPAPPFAEPASPASIHSPEYNLFVNRIRQELDRISVEFEDLQISNVSETNLAVSFTGLRNLPDEGTNADAAGKYNEAINQAEMALDIKKREATAKGLETQAKAKQREARTTAGNARKQTEAPPDGIQVSNEDTEVSISLANGIQIKDKKNPNKTTISLPFVHISVNDDPEDSGQAVDGALAGSRLSKSVWQFAGTKALADVQFEMTNLDLPAVLAPQPASGKAHDMLAERLDAAKAIVETTTKDQALGTLATDAAKVGDVEVATSALGEMVDRDARDAATHDAALQLARLGLHKDAIEMARSITDPDIRDEVMSALAGDPKLLGPKNP